MTSLFRPSNRLKPQWQKSIYALPTLRASELKRDKWITLYPRLKDFWDDAVHIRVTTIRGGLHQIETRVKNLERLEANRLRFVAVPAKIWNKNYGWVHYGPRGVCPKCRKPKKLLRWVGQKWICDYCSGVGCSHRYKHKNEIRYQALENKIKQLNVKLKNPQPEDYVVPRKVQQQPWRTYVKHATRLQKALDEHEHVFNRWAGVPRHLERFEEQHRKMASRMPKTSKLVKLVDAARYFGIPATTIRTLARDPERGYFSGLWDIEPRYLEEERLWIVDFHRFRWWAEHCYRCEPIAKMPEPEELVALNPDYVSKDEIVKAYPDIRKTHINYWLRFRERFGLGNIVKRNGRVLFVHRGKFREWVLNNGIWASPLVKEELNGLVLKYRYNYMSSKEGDGQLPTHRRTHSSST